MPISEVTVEYDVYQGEDPQEVQDQAIEYAQNRLFEEALKRNIPLPKIINVGVRDGLVQVWYEYQQDTQVILMCPQCDEQLIGHNRHQLRDLLAKHYEIAHPQGE